MDAFAAIPIRDRNADRETPEHGTNLSQKETKFANKGSVSETMVSPSEMTENGAMRGKKI